MMWQLATLCESACASLTLVFPCSTGPETSHSTIDQRHRPSARELLAHPWLSADTAALEPVPSRDLLPNMRKQFDAKKCVVTS